MKAKGSAFGGEAERGGEICDICGEPLPDGHCYEMPDGLRVCLESDCLADWADYYRV
ncbi:MAG: hypothetical protein K6G17_01655 [Oscillospiraceae bacterium]|nr:hypothetical protein [Oscillospiraceae bacterium]